MRKFWILFLTLILLGNLVYGSRRPQIGAKPIGFGSAFISNSEDAFGALWNPAGLANLVEIEFDYDLSQGGFSVGLPIFESLTLGTSFFDLNGTDRFMIDQTNNPIGTFERGRNQAVFSLAGKFGSQLLLGANLNLTTDVHARRHPSYDLGILINATSGIRLGASLREFGDQYREPVFDLGMTWQTNRYFQLSSALDTTTWKFRIGTELSFHRLSLRYGSIFHLDGSRNWSTWSAGSSVRISRSEISYAYIEDQERENRHFISVSFTFGLPTGIGNNNYGKSKIIRTSNVETIANQYNLEIELLLSMIRVESAFKPNAISKSGAVGLGQLMPPTARDLGLRVPDYENITQPNHNSKIDERFNAGKNLEGAARYLRMMLDRYNNNYALGISAYNAGPGRVRENVPAIRETERHVGKVLNYYYQYKNKSELKNQDLLKLNQAIKRP